MNPVLLAVGLLTVWAFGTSKTKDDLKEGVSSFDFLIETSFFGALKVRNYSHDHDDAMTLLHMLCFKLIPVFGGLLAVLWGLGL
jgi:hypothetical protein